MSGSIVEAMTECYRKTGAHAALDRVTLGPKSILVETTVHTGDRSIPSAGLAHRPAGEPIDARAYTLETLLAAAARSDTVPDELVGDVPRAIGLATLNAVSAPFLDVTTGDPMESLSASVDRIATVGLFRPAFRKFGACDVRVIERRAVAADSIEHPADVSVSLFAPEAAQEAMADAELVFVTGSTLIYGGLEQYLSIAPETAQTIVIGATASGFPEPLFSAGADIVAGVVVDDPDRVRKTVLDGGCGTDLHDAGVRKVYARPQRDKLTTDSTQL